MVCNKVENAFILGFPQGPLISIQLDNQPEKSLRNCRGSLSTETTSLRTGALCYAHSPQV